MTSKDMADIQKNIPLASLTSFKVGGQARYFLEPESVEEVVDGGKWADSQSLPCFVLGKGTNLVFSDSGFDGLVIYAGQSLAYINWNDYVVTAGAGALLNNLVNQSAEKGFEGIHRLAGIPGTVGGGVFINAGAFGQELCQTITRVKSFDLERGIIERAKEQCEFKYRGSLFCELKEVILEAEMQLVKGDPEKIKSEVDDTLKRREEKQPLDFPNAGSVFKRPAGKYAGQLIEHAGLKGHTCGGAQVSEKHANFIINLGTATAQDIYDLSEEVIKVVREKSGVTLEREVRMIGNFLPWPR
jgi:UDP-N-acetylmuramate dehydrogenase